MGLPWWKRRKELMEGKEEGEQRGVEGEGVKGGCGGGKEQGGGEEEEGEKRKRRRTKKMEEKGGQWEVESAKDKRQ